MNAKSRKNLRRVESADAALRAVTRNRNANQLRRSRPIKQNPRRPSSGPVDSATAYIQSCYADVLVPSFGLPSPNYSGPVTAMTLRGSYRLKAGLAGSNGYSTVVLNPSLLPFTQFSYEKLANGAMTDCAVPTIFMNSQSVNHTGIPVQDDAVNNISALSMSGQSVTTSTHYTGKTRCLGIKFRLTYTGTLLDRGGEVVIFDNPTGMSFLCQSDNATTAAGFRFRSAFNSSDEIDIAYHAITRLPLDNVVEWVWRPTDLEFKDFSTRVADIASTVAGSSIGTALAAPYLPSMDCPNACTSLGWTCGFQIRPGKALTNADANYRLEIESVHEALFSVLDSSVAGSTAGGVTWPTTHHVSRNSPQSDRISNSLSVVHSARRRTNFSGKSLRIPYKGTLSSLVKSGADALMNAAAERAVASLA